MVIGADDLPLLDEPLPVELANSWYTGEGGVVFDFLGTPDLVRLWFGTASVASGFVLPSPLEEADVAEIRGLRDAIRAVLEALATGSPLSGDALDVVNRNAARSPSVPRLRWPADVGRMFAGTPLDVLLGRLATAAIDFVVGGSVGRLRRCAGLGCGMFYVQEHHRRRWCHDSCGHRARQARYYRRKHDPSASGDPV